MKYDIECNFSSHPMNKAQLSRSTCLRDTSKGFAMLIDYACPDSREKSLAFTKLEECLMWCNAAIARYPEEEEETAEYRGDGANDL